MKTIAQPIKNATPPSGVIAPNLRMPLRLRAYKLPENNIIPANRNHPAITISDALDELSASRPSINSPRA